MPLDPIKHAGREIAEKGEGGDSKEKNNELTQQIDDHNRPGVCASVHTGDPRRQLNFAAGAKGVTYKKEHDS